MVDGSCCTAAAPDPEDQWRCVCPAGGASYLTMATALGTPWRCTGRAAASTCNSLDASACTAHFAVPHRQPRSCQLVSWRNRSGHVQWSCEHGAQCNGSLHHVDARGLGVRVRDCPPIVEADRFGHLGSSIPLQRQTKDLEMLITRALVTRFGGGGHSLEFVPSKCLHEAAVNDVDIGSMPRRFTTVSGPWGFSWPHNKTNLAAGRGGGCVSLRSPLCGADGAARSWPALAVLSVEAPSYIPTSLTGELLPMGSGATAPVPPIDASLRVFQVPWPSVGAWRGDEPHPNAPSIESRPALAALVGNMHTASGADVGHGPLRSALLAECVSASPGVCLNITGARGADGGLKNLNALPAEAAAHVVNAYQSAVFCLQPWGDTATRKGFFDALASGCVNVLFSEAGYNETDAWFGDHRQWTLRVPLEAVHKGAVLPFLRRALDRGEASRLHANVMAARRRLQYNDRGFTQGGDAVDVIVERLLETFDAAQLEASERHRQEIRAPLERFVCSSEFCPF
eukprot:Transcript_28868.p1 GENE.Transcript_28868~~Transcript_28868.p1  ORF type:complete len:512 (+),score=35.47 Transcript_28868:205-1740(+)